MKLPLSIIIWISENLIWNTADHFVLFHDRKVGYFGRQSARDSFVGHFSNLKFAAEARLRARSCKSSFCFLVETCSLP